MEETRNTIRSSSRTLSITEMQKQDVYVRRDIKTANPRRLFRNLRNTLDELGYKLETDVGMEVNKDAIGETGYIDANLSATKGQEKTRGNWRKFLAGIIIFVLGFIFLFGDTALEIIGLIMFFLGLALMYINWNRTTSKYNQIWIHLEGEVYGAEASELQGKKGMKRGNIVSELTAHIAGKASSNSVSDKDSLRAEVNQLANKINSLA